MTKSCDQMVPQGSDDELSPGFPVPLGTNETENPTQDSNAADRPETTTVSMEEEDCLQEKVSKFSSEEEEMRKRASSSSSADVEEERQVSGVGVVNNVSDEMLLCVDEQLDSDSSQEHSD